MAVNKTSGVIALRYNFKKKINYGYRNIDYKASLAQFLNVVNPFAPRLIHRNLTIGFCFKAFGPHGYFLVETPKVLLFQAWCKNTGTKTRKLLCVVFFKVCCPHGYSCRRKHMFLFKALDTHRQTVVGFPSCFCWPSWLLFHRTTYRSSRLWTKTIKNIMCAC